MGCPHPMNKRSSSSFVLPLSLFFVFLVVIHLENSVGTVSAREYSGNKQARNSTLESIYEYLRKINKPAVKTVEAPGGYTIACVDKWKQPAFDHPLLKNYKPEFPPEIPTVKRQNYNNNSSETSEVWPIFDPECPDGTVPIRRITVDDVLRAKSLEEFGKKKRGNPFAVYNNTAISPNSIDNILHEYAVLSSPAPSNVGLFEASAKINVWTPHIATEGEMSISQIWLAGGEPEGPSLNTIEAGWMVYPKLYGNSRTHLFVYWTADNYVRTGCHDLRCPGFIQVDKKIIVGTELSPISVKNGLQYEIILRLYKNHTTGDWWLNYGLEETKVGYWPGHLFTTLRESASEAQWGGEIVNARLNHVHTSTEMGSNRFPEEGFKKASYFKDVAYVDSTKYHGPPKIIRIGQTNANCYRLSEGFDDFMGYHFFYGGRGNNLLCP